MDQKENGMPTEEFKRLRDDPDMESEAGPAGTLVFRDGGAYCVVGPEFAGMEESGGYAFGDTREQALANYFERVRGRKS